MQATRIFRRALLAAAFGAAALLSACASAPRTGAPAEARAALAPTGTLRIAVYPGSPTSLVERTTPGNMRGVSVDLGRALAARLGVPAVIEVYPRQAEAFGALQRGDADLMITNATAERAKVVDFAPPLVDLELGVLVPAASRVTAVEAIDQPGIVVGVSQGSSSERVLGARYRHAKLRTFPTLDAAGAALVARQVDAFATNKGILFELADRVPGSHVLPGRWGAEHLAAGIPQAHAAGLPLLRAFTEQVRSDGELARAMQRAGLRGTAAPQR
jgi:polar amino acid transport system substrate-binding protein